MASAAIGNGVVFLARMQAVVEELDVDSAKADLASAKDGSKAIRDEIKSKEKELSKKQADLDAHLERGPGVIERVTGIGGHDAITNQKKDDVQMTEADIEKEEAKLKKERDEISQALTAVKDALSASSATRRDVESMLDDKNRLAQRIMKG